MYANCSSPYCRWHFWTLLVFCLVVYKFLHIYCTVIVSVSRLSHCKGKGGYSNPSLPSIASLLTIYITLSSSSSGGREGDAQYRNTVFYCRLIVSFVFSRHNAFVYCFSILAQWPTAGSGRQHPAFNSNSSSLNSISICHDGPGRWVNIPYSSFETTALSQYRNTLYIGSFVALHIIAKRIGTIFVWSISTGAFLSKNTYNLVFERFGVHGECLLWTKTSQWSWFHRLAFIVSIAVIFLSDNSLKVCDWLLQSLLFNHWTTNAVFRTEQWLHRSFVQTSKPVVCDQCVHQMLAKSHNFFHVKKFKLSLDSRDKTPFTRFHVPGQYSTQARCTIINIHLDMIWPLFHRNVLLWPRLLSICSWQLTLKYY